ncbi:hypothetical protein J7E71_07370 [Mesobacillus foraminis]|uniref:hypothetical protein n=1 Tax=Mesobacillus foraminis TaxID=279826 RepID=UPI001BE82037|nr:hypothetical protein [Mesobacillus foraminis]MBT2755763.1 hypothetical protein [Mesobacillus foraminis]
MKNVGLVLLVTLLMALATGCSQNEDKLNLLFFSELPTEVEDEVGSVITKKTGEDDKLQLEFYPFHHEKITIELAGRNGDIFFVPQEDVKNMIDPIAFTALTEMADDQLMNGVPLEEFKGKDPDTGEWQVYAVPVGNESLLIKEIGMTLQKPLAAFIPNYSEDKEEALELLKYLTNN